MSTAPPPAASGSQRDRCASSPNSAIVCAATVVGTIGTGATVRPISSSTTQVSRKPRPAAAVRLGQADAEEPGVGEGLPGPAVEPVVGRLDLGEALVRDQVLEDLGREVAQRRLVLVEREVERGFAHAVVAHLIGLGILRPNTEMRSRCTSLVPPPKVMIRVPW